MSAPLDSSANDLEAMLNAAVRRLLRWFETLEDQPSHATDTVPERLAAFRETLPESGQPLDGLLDRLFEDVIPWSFNTAGPGYMAYVPGGGLPSAAVAELLAAITNRYAGVCAAAPVVVEIETQVLRWLCELMGMPKGALGVMTTGGSLSNFIGTVAARHDRLGEDLGGACAYVSPEVHHCMTKALRLAGIPSAGIRTVPVDDQYRLDPEALRALVQEDRAAGKRPFLACASAGTVNTGAVDPLDAIADVCADEDLWFHVDGAYGALFRLVPELEEPLRGIERADSLVLDPHKGLFLPYGTGVLLVKNLQALRAAHHADAAYLPPLHEGEEQVDFCNLSPELSRDWRGIRLWLPFMLHGVSAFRDALREKRQLAVHAADTLAQEPGIVLAHRPQLSLFAFRQTFEGLSRDEENARNKDLLDRINGHRRAMLTATEIDDTFWLRICVLHLRTHKDRMDEVLGIVRGELRRPGGSRTRPA